MNESREDCYYCGAMLTRFEDWLCSLCESWWLNGTSRHHSNRKEHMQCVEEILEKSAPTAEHVSPKKETSLATAQEQQLSLLESS